MLETGEQDKENILEFYTDIVKYTDQTDISVNALHEFDVGCFFK